MPKPLLPVLERALRGFETDTGVRPRTVYVTPKQRAQLYKEMTGSLAARAPGEEDSILGVRVVTDRNPKAARIRELLPERDVARIETVNTPHNFGLRATVIAFGRHVQLALPMRFNFGGWRSPPESTMSREELIAEAATHFAKIVPEEDLLREEVRVRPARRLQDTALNRARSAYDRYWVDEIATADMSAFMNTTISSSQIAAGSITSANIPMYTRSAEQVARNNTAAEMLAQMETARRQLDHQAEAYNRGMELMRGSFVEQAYMAPMNWAALRDPALTGLTVSAPARPATSAGTPESPQSEWHWNGPAR